MVLLLYPTVPSDNLTVCYGKQLFFVKGIVDLQPSHVPWLC